MTGDHAAVRATTKARTLVAPYPGPLCVPLKTTVAHKRFVTLDGTTDSDNVSVHEESHAL
jgi:hypothetical protein